MEPIAAASLMQSALQSYASGRWHETEQACRRILAVEPRHPQALHLLGTLAHRAGHPDDAIALMTQAIALDPRVAEYHSNVAVVLTTRGRCDEAIAACHRALELHPDLVDAHYNLANALRAAGRPDEAVASYRRALALKFDLPQVHNNLGNALKELGRIDDAAGAYRQALFFEPNHAHARSNLALALEDGGDVETALVEHRRAVETAPADAAIHGNLLLCLHYQPGLDGAAILRESRRWGERHGEPLRALAVAAPHDRTVGRPLRVGYLSADLRLHAAAHFVLPLLQAHDRQAIHVTCYPTSAREDDVTARLRAASDRWSSLAGLPDAVAAQRIRDDRIDVLVDLGGHTADNRLPLFARKPAPVQVTFIGHPGTTGLDAVDARITDAIADPYGEEPFAVERPMRVAPGAWCFMPLHDAPQTDESPAVRDGHVTFGSFNALKKVTGPTLELWTQILQRLPTARLILKNRSLGDPAVAARLLRRLTDAGVAASRVELLPGEPSVIGHLRTYERIDIGLDPCPFSGVTTTCEALWMGVPVITLAGVTHASRVGASLLSAVGLPRCIADTPADYVERAVRLADDPTTLRELRGGLRERMRASPLMDARRYAAQVETIYHDLWRTWCAAPRP